MAPRPYRLRSRRRETHDTVTLSLDPLDGSVAACQPGQFNMLYCFGIGEIPISVSGQARPDGPVLHTVRSVGAVSAALCRLRTGEVIGLRGPFGAGWGLDGADGADLVLIAGGVGLAPLRSALAFALANRRRFGRLVLLVGARSPQDLLFARELRRLQTRPDVQVAVTVDRGAPGWGGSVGVVTQLLPAARFDPASALALVCGPEVMMRFSATALLGRGLGAEQIRVSLERNMKCAIGWCGHCQLGGEFVCRDGPVNTWAQAAPLLQVKER
ncbi:MAG TPA: FAD/NAD(P)-binding protein [Acidimicrobiales bacterium]|nr:FAD/NAD(P)-binding protein [Acidimicrobiales bacterium]